MPERKKRPNKTKPQAKPSSDNQSQERAFPMYNLRKTFDRGKIKNNESGNEKGSN